MDDLVCMKLLPCGDNFNYAFGQISMNTASPLSSQKCFDMTGPERISLDAFKSSPNAPTHLAGIRGSDGQPLTNMEMPSRTNNVVNPNIDLTDGSACQ